MLPVTAKVPVEGSYSSALLVGVASLTSPPAIRTLPSRSKVEVKAARAVVILPVAVKVPGGCAVAMGTWPIPKQRSERMSLQYDTDVLVMEVNFIGGQR